MEKRTRFIVHYRNGKQEGKTPQEFLSLTAESNGQTNEIHKEIDYVERKLPAAFLKDVTIIDSPGLNAIKEAHGAATRRFMDNADVVIWMLSAEKAGSLTEIKAMEELPPEIKPIALVNKMDLVDEEEDSPEELLDNIRGLLGDHVQQVIGISAEYALQGKLQNNAPMLEASAISDFYKVYEDAVTANAAEYKMNGILRDIAEFIYDIGKDFEELDQVDSEEIKAKTVPVIDSFKVLINTIWEYSQSIPDSTVTQVFRGVLYLFGFIVNQNEDNTILLLEKAAKKNDRTALTLLGRYYLNNGEHKKALNYVHKGAELGCVDCQVLLAGMYSGEEYADSIKAYKYAKLAYEQNNELGYYALGLCLLVGLGGKQDINQAINCFEKCEEMMPTGDGFYIIGKYYREMLEPSNIPKAIEYYQKAIKAGNKDALEAISFCYDAIENYKLAFIYLRSSADYNKASAGALCLLGLYYHGDVEEYIPADKSPEVAFKYFKKSAEMGYAKAQYILSQCYFTADGVLESIPDSIYWLRKSAENNCVEAQIELASRYRNGHDVSLDEKEAFKWMNKAAHDDFSGRAYNYLGVYYDDGIGTDINHGFAFTCYEKSAERGYVWGIYNSGICYRYGRGTNIDNIKAFQYFKKAAEAGLAEAQYELGLCYELGKGSGQGYSVELARPWYQKAANQGNKDALERLRILKLRQQADNGDIDAQFRVGEYFDDTNNAMYDHEIAWQYLLKAAANGHAYAQYKVGLKYVSNDSVKACQWFANAANQGLANAQYEYGKCLVYGVGTQENIFQGKNWIEKAANQENEQAKTLLVQLNQRKTDYSSDNKSSDEDSGCTCMGCTILVIVIIVILKIIVH